MKSIRVSDHVEWVPDGSGNRYQLELQAHEVDLVLDALYMYAAMERARHPRTADLADALRRILLKSTVAVLWDIERVEALPALPPEST